MRIDVSGKHIIVTPALQEYASSKCARLPKYYDGVQQVHVVFDQVRHEAGDGEGGLQGGASLGEFLLHGLSSLLVCF